MESWGSEKLPPETPDGSSPGGASPTATQAWLCANSIQCRQGAEHLGCDNPELGKHLSDSNREPHQASSGAPLKAQWPYTPPNTMGFNLLVSRVLPRLDLNTILKIIFKTSNRHTQVCDMPNVNHHRPHDPQVSIVIPTSEYRLSCQRREYV